MFHRIPPVGSTVTAVQRVAEGVMGLQFDGGSYAMSVGLSHNKTACYLNDPGKLPSIYSTVRAIELSDVPGGQNTIRFDDGGVIMFTLAEGERKIVAPSKEASRRVAASWLGKTADLGFDQTLQTFLAYLKALHWLHWTLHWTSAGPASYSDHLLFERLYTGVQGEIDSFAEKIVGMRDMGVVSPVDSITRTLGAMKEWESETDPVQKAYRAENDFYAFLNEMLQRPFPPGMENFLQGVADAHDTHLYLLRQRLAPLTKMASSWSKGTGKQNPRVTKSFDKWLIKFDHPRLSDYIWTTSESLKPGIKMWNGARPQEYDSQGEAEHALLTEVLPHIVQWKSDFEPYITGWDNPNQKTASNTPPYAPDTDARGEPLQPGDFVSQPLYPKGTMRGWVSISPRAKTQWVDPTGQKLWLPALAVTDEQGTVYALSGKAKKLPPKAPPSNIRLAKSNAKFVEIPSHHHPVEVLPPQIERDPYPFEGFIDFQGLKIDVENAQGSVRSGKGPEGEWSTEMFSHYGEIRGTEGVDDDPLDVYVGDNADSSLVVVIHQHNPWDGKYDEDKVMLGFDSVEEAIGAYKKQYDRPGFFRPGPEGSTVMPIGSFWRWVHDEKKQGTRVKLAKRASSSTKSQQDYILHLLKQQGLTTPTEAEVRQLNSIDAGALIEGLKKKRGKPVFYGNGTFSHFEKASAKKPADLQWFEPFLDWAEQYTRLLLNDVEIIYDGWLDDPKGQFKSVYNMVQNPLPSRPANASPKSRKDEPPDGKLGTLYRGFSKELGMLEGDIRSHGIMKETPLPTTTHAWEETLKDLAGAIKLMRREYLTFNG